MAHQINWDCSKSEMVIIKRIGKRALKMYQDHGYPDEDLTDILMDITACHCNGNPLDLSKLEHADDFNFAHDVGGIRRHICRRTGKLLDFFVPRMSSRMEEGARCED